MPIDRSLEKFIKDRYVSLDKCQQDIEAKIRSHITYRAPVFSELNRMLNEYRAKDHLHVITQYPVEKTSEKKN